MAELSSQLSPLSPDQRHDYYEQAATRTGVHQPILAALYSVQGSPQLLAGETGLGIAPAHRIAVAQVNTFAAQVHYAANTLRSLISALIAAGWTGNDLWDQAQGRYSDRLVQRIAEGYVPASTDEAAARLETCEPTALLKAYGVESAQSLTPDLMRSLPALDDQLLAFTATIAAAYHRLDFQRQALLETVRIWRRLDDWGTTIAAIAASPFSNLPSSPPQDQPQELAQGLDEPELDNWLLEFSRQIPSIYAGYPHQRESLLRLTQLWQQLDSREATLAWLQREPTDLTEPDLALLDPALIVFVQRLPQHYRRQGYQRLALTEAYQAWRQLPSRTAALAALGASPQYLSENRENPQALAQAAGQVDQALFAFIQAIPTTYQGTEDQREALISLVQRWRQLERRGNAVQSLWEDMRRLTRAPGHSLDAAPPPQPQPQPQRPKFWTPDNLTLAAPIIPNGRFTWAQATRGGTQMPPNQVTVDHIIRIAELAQTACDRIDRPFVITHWYGPLTLKGEADKIFCPRHALGDALNFYVEGLTADQIYWALDPWWVGSLGRYQQFPHLIYLDACGYCVRWQR